VVAPGWGGVPVPGVLAVLSVVAPPAPDGLVVAEPPAGVVVVVA
jgi:hypothetical protein